MQREEEFLCYGRVSLLWTSLSAMEESPCDGREGCSINKKPLAPRRRLLSETGMGYFVGASATNKTREAGATS